MAYKLMSIKTLLYVLQIVVDNKMKILNAYSSSMHNVKHLPSSYCNISLAIKLGNLNI